MATITRISQLTGAGEYLNGATGVFVSGNYAYVTGYDSDSFVIIDISNKLNPTRISQLTGAGEYLNGATGVFVSGNYAYVTSWLSDAFVIIDISNKSNPTRVGQVTGTGNYLGGAAKSVIVGNYAFVTAYDSDAFVIIDISNKTAPVRIAQITGSGNYLGGAYGLTIVGDYAFVTSRVSNSLVIINISSKTSPWIEGHETSVTYLNNPKCISIDGDYALIGSTDKAVVYNISNKTSPSYVDSIGPTHLSEPFDSSLYWFYFFLAVRSSDAVTVVNTKVKSNIYESCYISGAGEYLDGAKGVFTEDGHYVYATSSISDAFVVLEFTPDIPDAPTNIVVTPDIEENEISWDTVVDSVSYNLYWMKYEFFTDDFSTDLSGWAVYKDTGTETVQISCERLYGSNTVGTNWHIVNKNNIPSGDFDIQVDLVTYTPDDNDNGLYAAFKILDEYPFISVDSAEIYYYVSSGGSQYNITTNLWINGSNYDTAITIAGQPTKFRITRVGTTVSVYYYISSWVQVDSMDFGIYAANLILSTIEGLKNSGNGGVLEFDNFDFYVDVKTLGTKISTVTSPYDHTSLDSEENYIYVLTSENAGGESGASSIVNGIPLSPPYLPPTGITVEKDEGQNTITFVANPSADYTHIYWDTSPGVTKETGTKISDVTSPYIHDGLNPNPTYYYILTSENIYGEGPPSSEYNNSPFPKPPTGIGAEAGVEKNTIYWTESLGADSYNIYWNDSPGVTKLNGTKITGVTSPHIHLGLEAFIPIYYVVTAEDEDGESSISEEIYSIPLSPVGLELPQDPVDQYTILSTFSDNDYDNISKLNYVTIGTSPISGYNKVAGNLYNLYENIELNSCKTDNSFDLEEISSTSINITPGRCIIGGVCIDIKEDKVLNIDDEDSYFNWANIITGVGTLYVLIHYDYDYNPSIGERRAYIGLMKKTEYNALTTNEKDYYCFLGAIKVNSSVEIISPLYYWDPDNTSQDRPHPKGFADGGWLDLPDKFIY